MYRSCGLFPNHLWCLSCCTVGVFHPGCRISFCCPTCTTSYHFRDTLDSAHSTLLRAIYYERHCTLWGKWTLLLLRCSSIACLCKFECPIILATMPEVLIFFSNFLLQSCCLHMCYLGNYMILPCSWKLHLNRTVKLTTLSYIFQLKEERSSLLIVQLFCTY